MTFWNRLNLNGIYKRDTKSAYHSIGESHIIVQAFQYYRRSISHPDANVTLTHSGNSWYFTNDYFNISMQNTTNNVTELIPLAKIDSNVTNPNMLSFDYGNKWNEIIFDDENSLSPTIPNNINYKRTNTTVERKG